MTASLRRSLEAELAASPDDVAAHAAYADLLGELDDPRGELIQVQMALEDASLDEAQRDELTAREAELWQNHSGRFLGGLAAPLMDDQVCFTFRRGWLDELSIGNLSLALARALRDAPEARLLRTLSVKSARDDTPTRADDNVSEGDAHPGLWPLAGSPALANLRSFTLGDEDAADFPTTAAVVPLARSMPRVEELFLYARHDGLTHLFTLQGLKSLRVLAAAQVAQVHRLDVLAANAAFRNLTHLLLRPAAMPWRNNRAEDERAGFVEAEGYLPLRVVEALLTSSHLPRLTHLQLRDSTMGDVGCQCIVSSGALRRLRGLDLRRGRITDVGARALAECPEVRQLTWLDLSDNALSAAMAERVKALGIPCRV